MKRPKKFRETARGANPHALLLIALYREAEQKIVELVRSAILLPGGRRQSRRTRSEVLATLTTLQRRSPIRVRRLVESAYAAGGSAVMGEKRSGRKLSAIDTTTADVLIDNLNLRLTSAARVVGRRVDDTLRNATIQAAIRQVEAEAPMGQAAADLEREFRRRGATGFVDRAGRRWKLSTYAEMAIRTTTSEALALGTREKMLERGFDLVEVSSHRCNHHPGDPTHPCVTLEGQTLSITGLTEGYEMLPRWPLHPRCSHYFTPSPLAFDQPEPPAAALPELVPA